MKKNTAVSVLSKIIILLLVFFAGAYVGGLKENADAAKVSESESQKEGQVNLMIDYATGEIDAFQDIAVNEGDSVFDVLEAATDREEIDLVYEDYGGELGVLVTSIDGVGGGNSSAYWQYWVNGEYATVGMSSQTLEGGDVVFLKFTGHNPAR